LVRVILLVLIGFLQLLLAPKFLIYVISPVITNSNNLVLLVYGWYMVGILYFFANNMVLDIALNMALT
jgi:hypothetical protein